jgi:hypothetical protein
MCRRINFSLFASGLSFFVLGILSACGFADLRPIGITVCPGGMNEILPGEDSPVVLEFDAGMIQSDVEKAVQINSESGPLEGDLFWQGNSLFFVPLPGWTPGVRYTLSLSGTVYSQDGRELRLDRYIPFYALFRSAAPLLESFSPGDGASVEVKAAGNCVVELRFSLPMNRTSVEDAFTMEGLGDRSFQWDDDDRLLRVMAGKTLSPWTVYRWILGTGARSREGVPLAKDFSARFCTDRDRLFLRVLQAFPMIRSGPGWLSTGFDLDEGLEPGQGIGIEFNKAAGGNLSGSVRFDPSLPGRIETISETAAVFIPDRDPEPDTVYTLIVSGDLQDAGGLRMGADYTRDFTVAFPFLRVLSVAVDESPPLEPDYSAGTGKMGGPLAAPVDIARGNVVRLTIHFSELFTEEAKHEAPFRITLKPFFPGNLEAVALRSLIWLADDRICMDWEGLIPGVAGEAHYYRLDIPGGRGGIGSGGGMYLREDNFLFLEAIK